jgi:hypothetical protein
LKEFLKDYRKEKEEKIKNTKEEKKQKTHTEKESRKRSLIMRYLTNEE